MRENAQSRPNWNLYVGDSIYKTNFWLKFNSVKTAMDFRNQKLASSMFSFRYLLLLQFVYLCRIDSFLGTSVTQRYAGVNYDAVEPLADFKFRISILVDFVTMFLTENWSNICFFIFSLLGTFRRDLSTLQRQILMVSGPNYENDVLVLIAIQTDFDRPLRNPRSESNLRPV